MKLPSIHYLITSAKISFLRFPLTIISSIIAVTISIYLIEHENEIPNMLPYINIMLCMAIGIPLYFCVTVIFNKKGFNNRTNIIFNLLATVILIAIYFSLPNIDSTHNTSLPYIKYALYNITCHLLVSFIPFVFSKQLNGFWHYNKTLFIRILASFVYSSFIYIGLIIALTSLKLLFDVNLHEQLYVEIWVVTIGVFNTWFFVSGIPNDFDILDTIYEYPKGLKTFSQFVLLPLLALYLIILYAYGSKILVLWDWPKGIVSYLIVFVSVLGILTFLLIYPYGNKAENNWINKTSKIYYILLLPLLVILFIAIFMRVSEYGITINRYAIVTLGIWLTIVCAYTIIGKTNIKFIPTSLAIILILISVGPWGMFSYSEHSQVKRLKHILEQSKIIVNNKLVNETIWIHDSLPSLNSNNDLKNEGYLNDSLHNEIKSILDYLDNHHGFSLVKVWYTQNLDSIINSDTSKKENSYHYSEAEIYMRTLGLKYEIIDSESEKSKISYNSNYNTLIKTTTGYDYLVTFNIYNYNEIDEEICNFDIDSTKYTLNYLNKKQFTLCIKSKTDAIYFDLETLIKDLQKEFGKKPDAVIPIKKMTLSNSSKDYEFKLEFHSIELDFEKNKPKLINISGDLFIKNR